MIDFHPPLTGFPGVILTLLVAAEVLRLFFNREKESTTTTFLMASLIFITPVTYFSGYFASEFAQQQGIPNEAIKRHQLYALMLLLSLFPLGMFFCFRNSSKIMRVLFYLALLISAGLVTVSSRLGGLLVFEYGAGVTMK